MADASAVPSDTGGEREGPKPVGLTVLKTFGLFVLALLGELGGTYAIWRWLRTDASALLAIVGVAALSAYAVVQTFQPEDRYGRLFAAYAGVFLVGALLWGWGIDGKQPDRFDSIGAAIVLTGVVVVLWGRRIFA
jgi:small multidrug resistance family-3 protein